LKVIPGRGKENKLDPWIVVLQVDDTLKDLEDLLGTLDLGLGRIFATDNLDGADDLADEIENIGRGEFRNATLRVSHLTVDGEAPPGTFADVDKGTLRKLVVR